MPLPRSYSTRIECRWCCASVFVHFDDRMDQKALAKIIADGCAKIEHDAKLCIGVLTEANDRLVGDLFSQ